MQLTLDRAPYAIDLDKLAGESGTWTPTIGGATSQSGQVYSAQAGYYTKFGRLCYVHAIVTLSTLGTITGNVRIKGLPFKVDAAANFRQAGLLWEVTSTSYVFMSAFFLTNSTDIELRGITAAATALSPVAQADLANTTTLIVSGVYQIA